MLVINIGAEYIRAVKLVLVAGVVQPVAWVWWGLEGRCGGVAVPGDHQSGVVHTVVIVHESRALVHRREMSLACSISPLVETCVVFLFAFWCCSL